MTDERWVVVNLSYTFNDGSYWYAGEKVGSWVHRADAKVFDSRNNAHRVACLLAYAQQGNCTVRAAPNIEEVKAGQEKTG